MSNGQKIIAAAIAALAVVVAVVGGVVIAHLSAAADRNDYDRCLAIYGLPEDALKYTPEEVLRIAERCDQ